MNKDSIGNRMKKNYEDRYRIKLTRRTPVILRLDGKSFHTITKSMKKPYDIHFKNAMLSTACYIIVQIQGAKCAYIQSDEISLLLTDFDDLQTQGWLDYNIQKIVSVSSGMASAWFSSLPYIDKIGVFDCRVFNIPKEEVCNYFIWRQKDWIRNSVQMLAQSLYSSKELHKKNQKDMHEMIHQKGENWVDLDNRWKNGTFIYKDGKEYKIRHDVIFTEEREVVEQYLQGE